MNISFLLQTGVLRVLLLENQRRAFDVEKQMGV